MCRVRPLTSLHIAFYTYALLFSSLPPPPRIQSVHTHTAFTAYSRIIWLYPEEERNESRSRTTLQTLELAAQMRGEASLHAAS